MDWIKNLFNFGGKNKSYLGTRYALNHARYAAGEYVSKNNIYQLPAVVACVKAISETLGTLPVYTYEKMPDGSRKRDDTHPVYHVLERSPNNYTSPTDFKISLFANALTFGNGYALIKKESARVKALYILDPLQMEIWQAGDELRYVYMATDGYTTFCNGAYDSSQIIHIKNVAINGVLGLNPIEEYARTFGINLAGERLAEMQMQNGNIIGVKYRFPGMIPNAVREETLNKIYSKRGVDGAFEPFVMEHGSDVEYMQNQTEQMQWLNSRQFQQRDIFRCFRIPPHIVGDLEKSSFNNIAVQSTEFLRFTLQPWIQKLTEEINLKLYFEEEYGKYYSEFFTTKLTKGTQQEIDDSNAKNLLSGIYTPNQVLESLNLPTIGEAGNKHWFPLNYTTLEDLYAEKQQAKENMQLQMELDAKTTEPKEEVIAAADTTLIENDIERQLKTKEKNALAKALKRRDRESFLVFATEWYGKHEQLVRDRYRIPFTMQKRSAEELEHFAKQYINESINRLKNSEDLEQTIKELAI